MATHRISIAGFGHATQPTKFLSRISRGSKFGQVRHEPMSTPSTNGVGAKNENCIIRTRMQPRDCHLLPGPKHLQRDSLPSFKCNGNSASLGQVRLHYFYVAAKFLSWGHLSDMPHAHFVVYPYKLKFARCIQRQRG
jgi:hypothetical protein